MEKQKQMEMVSIEDLVSSDHIYRRFHSLWNFELAKKHLRGLEKDNNYKGYGIVRLFKCLLLQFMEDLSDIELERFLKENNASKWFCDFGLAEVTPCHTVFTRLRKKIGAKKLAKIFAELRDQLKSQGYINEIFSFVYA